MKTGRLDSVEQLRGLAAVSVAWFHFTQGPFLPDGWLKASGTHGWLGVEVFFVISGFVIPYSMHSGGFRLHRDLGRFISKRLLRLEPPYLASIVLVLLLLFLSSNTPGFRGEQPEVTFVQLLLHLAYLNAFFEEQWLSPVYWTLAIEFQYYLVACFSYPLMFSATAWLRWALFAAWIFAALWIENDALLFHWLGLFMLGAVGCFFVTKTVRNVELSFLGVVALITAYVINGPLIAFIGVSTVIAIVKLSHLRFRVLVFLGTISYSLYLLHVPIGGRVINLASRLDQSMGRDIVALLLAMGISLLSAWFWYRYIERPSIGWAAKLKYSGREPVAADKR